MIQIIVKGSTKQLRQYRDNFMYTILFFVAYFIIVSRGLFEIYLTKQIGFIIQPIIWIIFLLYIVSIYK